MATEQLTKSVTKNSKVVFWVIVDVLRPRKQKGKRRWNQKVGLGFKTPRDAIEGNYVDKNVHTQVMYQSEDVYCPEK
eukprot:UN04769